MVMFDTLTRRMLPPYGGEEVIAPNFERLASRTATFDNCYAGSMPCMPARRELHTGRYNFLHRSWGPLEPFDDSVPEMLSHAGVHTHLVTDHRHYWGDGGATYHPRFRTYEFFRGQEGDAWKGQVADPEIPDSVVQRTDNVWRQDWVNRPHMATEQSHPQTLTFNAGLEFIETNKDEDRWFLQLEAFDPHEPFFSTDEYLELYESGYDGRHFDWPAYRRRVESDAEVEHLRNTYKALVTMCDRSLGRVLDAMDENDLWEDTMLIVCTDHGILLGEHNWWGKNVQPWYDENIHTPLFVWDPRVPHAAGERRDALVQTIDLGPTLLEFFGLPLTRDMQGRPLLETLADGRSVREAGLFGVAGGHANVTDGRFVYMRACSTPDNAPLFDYTLMPTHLAARFDVEQLRGAELVEPFRFTKGVRPLRVPAFAFGNPYVYGTRLYDLQSDPRQLTPLRDADLERRMATLLVEAMRETDAPAEQYERLGLPQEGPIGDEHLLVDAQWEQVLASEIPAPQASDFADDAPVATARVSDLLADDRSRASVLDVFPFLAHPHFERFAGRMTLVEVAAMRAEATKDVLDRLDADLTEGALAER